MAEAKIEITLSNGAKAGDTLKELGKQANALNKELRNLKPGTEEFINKASDLQKVDGQIGKIKTQIKGTTQASDSLKGSFGGILNQIPGFGTMAGAIAQARQGVGGLTSGFGLLRGAIIATGIGALVIAVSALVSWFSKTEKGANIVSGAFKGMGAVIDTLMNRLWNIGDTMKELFSDPISFFKNLGKDIKDAAVEGYELVQVFDDIEDRQRDLEVRSKEQEIAVDKLLLQAKNVGKTYEEKLAILEQADSVTRSSYKEQLSLSKEYLDAVEREVAAAEKSGTLGDDLLDKRKEAKLAYLGLVEEEVQIEEKIQNRRDQILDKQDKQNEKASEQRSKQNEQEAKDLESSLDKLEDLRIQAIRDSEEREIAEAELKFQRELESITLQGEEKIEAEKLIEESKGLEIQAIKDKYAAEAAARDKKNKDEQAKRDEDEAKHKKEIAESIAQTEAEIDSIRLDTARGTAAGLGEILTSQIKNEKAAKAARKTFAIADIGIRLVEELTANSAAAAKIAAQAPPYTIPAGVAYLAAANARSIIRAGIATAKVLVFKKGGYVQGPSHENGGVPGVIRSTGQPIEMEGEEFIFGKKATRGIGVSRLAKINDYYERKFAAGGPVSPFQSRPPVASNTNQGDGLMDTSGISTLIEQNNTMIQMLGAWPNKLKVINVATETEDAIKTVNEIRHDADV